MLGRVWSIRMSLATEPRSFVRFTDWGFTSCRAQVTRFDSPTNLENPTTSTEQWLVTLHPCSFRSELVRIEASRGEPIPARFEKRYADVAE